MSKIIQIILKNWKIISFVLPYVFKFIKKSFNTKKMEDTRKGFLTEDQEQTVDDLLELKGVAEMADGTAIKLADNKGLEMLKPSLIAKYGEDVLADIYEVVDMIFIPLNELAKNKK